MTRRHPIVRKWIAPPKLPEPINPALVHHAEQRAAQTQNRIADAMSTFVMISQNRADAKRQVVADQQWTTVQEEDTQNRELLELSNQILELTKAVHAYASAAADSSGRVPEPRPTTLSPIRSTQRHVQEAK